MKRIARIIAVVNINAKWLTDSLVAQMVKASAYNTGDPGSIPGWGRSPGEGNDNPLQYSCLENPMDRGASRAAVYGVAKSRTRLSDFTHSTYGTPIYKANANIDERGNRQLHNNSGGL